MKRKLILFTTIIVAGLTLVGCKATVKQVENKQNNNIVYAQEIDKKSSSDNDKLSYEIKKEVFEDKAANTKISYPKIVGYPGELLMDYMNQSLKKPVGLYVKKDSYSNINIDYKVTKMDKNIISVLFQGSGKLSSGRDITIQQSVNLDIKSTNEVTFNNFVKSDKASKEKVFEILNKKANGIGVKLNTETEGIRIYFKDEKAVFYFMPADDSAKKFIEIEVPIKELEGLINTDFGNRPAS
jgi:hypothetical protein